MKIVLTPHQYHALRCELARESAATAAEKAMSPDEVLQQGLDIANTKAHLDALNL